MIHGMMIVRNEVSRELEQKHLILSTVLNKMDNICDRFIIFDDNSDDGTDEYILSKNLDIYSKKQRMWDKNEVELRKELWEETIKEAKHGDWIICLDADEVLFNDDEAGYGEECRHLNWFLNNLPVHVDGVGFRLFDMWDMEHYREDNLWKAHFYPWTFAVRYDEQKEYKWHDKALHCGRFPANASERMLPTMIPVRHYGWALEEDRKKKYDRYMRIDGDGKHGILAQYESILDEKPNLVKFGGA